MTRSTLLSRSMSVVGFERKVVAGILLIVVAFLPVLGFAILSLSRIDASESRLEREDIATLMLAHDLRTEKAQQNGLMPIYVMTGEAPLLDQFRLANEAFDNTLRKLRAAPEDADTASLLDTIGALQGKLRSFEQPGIRMRQAGASVAEVNGYFRTQAGGYTGQIERALDALVDKATQRFERRSQHDASVFRAVIDVLVAASAVTLVFCAIVLAIIARLVEQKKKQDVLGRLLAEREREVSVARKQAVETVAHDLKNPLSAVSLLTELLQNHGADAAKAETWLQGIASSIESMRLLIANLLDHAKIEAGSLELDLASADLADFLGRLVARYQVIAGKKGLTLAGPPFAAVPPITMDAGRLEQVFSNLIGNALKFTPAGGTVELRLRRTEATLRAEVVDDGPGMSPEQAARVFDRYWQARDTAASGTGLGLAISKAIVEAHGGALTVRSALGQGSTFCVSLPLSDAAPAAEPRLEEVAQG